MARYADRDVGELLAERAADLEALRALRPGEDDLDLLRYALAFPNVQLASEAFGRARDLRAEYAWLLELVAAGQLLPYDAVIRQCLCIDEWPTRQNSGGPIWISRGGMMDHKTLLANVTEADIMHWKLYCNLQQWAICDQVTRETGKLVKVINVSDMADSSMFNTEMKVFKCFAEAKKVSDDLCPGLEAKTIMLNCPNWFWMMWRLCPAKTKAKDKIGICPVKGSATDDISKCPYVAMKLNGAALPTFLGGAVAELSGPLAAQRAQVADRVAVVEPGVPLTLQAEMLATSTMVVYGFEVTAGAVEMTATLNGELLFGPAPLAAGEDPISGSWPAKTAAAGTCCEVTLVSAGGAEIKYNLGEADEGSMPALKLIEAPKKSTFCSVQ